MPTNERIQQGLANLRTEAKLPEDLAPLMTEAQVTRLAREQRGDLDALGVTLARAENEVAEISEDLKREARTRLIGEAWDRLMPAIEDAMQRIRERTGTARAQFRHWTPAAYRRRAMFDSDPVKDAAVRSAWTSRLTRTPWSDLLEHLRDAVGQPHLALVEAVRLEIAGRGEMPETFRGEIHGLITALDRMLPTPRAATESLEQVIADADMAEIRLSESRSGKSASLSTRKIAAGLRARTNAPTTGAEVEAQAETDTA